MKRLGAVGLPRARAPVPWEEGGQAAILSSEGSCPGSAVLQ